MSGQGGAPPAGWYPDRQDPTVERWWDGQQWTDHVQRTQAAPPPPPQFQPLSGAAPRPPAPKKRRKLWIALGVIAALFVVAAIAGGGGDDDKAPAASGGENAASEAPKKSGQEVYAIGQPGKTSDIEVTVNAVADNYAIQYYEPDPGFRYVAVDISVKNLSDEQMTVSSVMQFELFNPTDHRQMEVVWATADNDVALDGTISTGAVRRGWVVFSVPEGVLELQMRVQGSLTANGALFHIAP